MKGSAFAVACVTIALTACGRTEVAGQLDTLALAAASAGPKLPAGCRFDATTGLSTCVTTTPTISGTQALPQGVLTVGDGSGASYIALKYFPIYNPNLAEALAANGINLETLRWNCTAYGTDLAVESYKTITTTYQGVTAGQGNKPMTTTTQTTTTYRSTDFFVLDCKINGVIPFSFSSRNGDLVVTVIN
ncbi:hypothetical protein [Deinococcus navajonensis]|uniref:Lipoprotein n=1 Tax=Deinococcus navajonensis TaxID=309884 RepID=A0ABV8XKL3_9DEIO